MAEATTVRLVSPSGEDTIVLPLTDPGEVLRFRALGWDEADYDGEKVTELRAEIDARNVGREEALSKPATKGDLVAVLAADDAAGSGAQ